MRFLYDGDCGFCTASARWLQRHVRPAVPIVPWQGEPAHVTDPLRDQLARSVVLLDATQQLRATAGNAVAILVTTSPHRWARWTGHAMRLPLVRLVVELIYRVIAANRYRLPGATASCAIAPD
ncbi:MAG: DUF393 domain-containing protein [Kineosporiaceae bacterium]|nr:DUF393 domain-containing protein [Kineosporiaceae bacterium]MBK7621670.1 DUF393 domain-containing protein [Kineosporiaceae bacterium]MBK8077159.1 DUF393 domain-containing protein [Kineosporiaceae bacterium]